MVQAVDAGSTGQLGANAATFTGYNCTVGALEQAWITQTVSSGYSAGGANQNPTLSDGYNVWGPVFGQWYNWTGGVYTYIGCFWAINTSNTKLSVSLSNWYSGAVSTAITLTEFTGNASSSPVDGSAYSVYYDSVTTGSGQTLNGTAFNTNVANDMVTCFLFDLYSGSSKVTAASAGTLFTLGSATDTANPADAVAIDAGVFSSAGSVTPSFAGVTISSGGADIVVIAGCAFKPVGAGAAYQPFMNPVYGPILAQ
jgi:hypothetical protein